MSRVMRQVRRVVFGIAGLTAVFAVGGLMGALVGGDGAVAVSAMAAHPCEQDECERGSWLPWDKDECVDNGGEETYCDMVGSGCKSRACAHTQ